MDSARLAVDTLETTQDISAAHRFGALGLFWRIVIVVIVLALGLEICLSFVKGFEGSGSTISSSGSSLSTSPGGLSVLSTLLIDNGDRIVRLQTSLSKARVLSPQSVGSPGTQAIPVGATIMIADPSSWGSTTSGDIASLRRALGIGDRVIFASSSSSSSIIASLIDTTPPSLSTNGFGKQPNSKNIGQVLPAGSALFQGVHSVGVPNGIVFSTSGSMKPLVGVNDDFFALGTRALTTQSRTRHDHGGVIVLSTFGAIDNQHIATDDNALFGLELLGSSGSTVVFDEFDHGYGKTGSGFVGLPWRWKMGILLALVALGVWILSLVRRFGPVDQKDSEYLPPRLAYVDAMGTILMGATKKLRAEAALSLQVEGHDRLASMLGLSFDAPPTAIVQAAHLAGVPADVVAAVLDKPGTNEELIEMGKIVADLESQSRGVWK